MRLPHDTLAPSSLARSLHLSNPLSSLNHHARDFTQHASPSLTKRDSSTTTTSSTTSTETCQNNASGNNCEKPTNSSAAIPIALGVVIPLLAATTVLLILHRRNKKRQAAQDAQDQERYKSMDFGMDLSYANGNKKKRGGPADREMEMNKGPQQHTRGLSVDALSHGPYMLSGNNDYAASLVSLSRMTDDVHNPYRQADAMSIRAPSPSIRGMDNDSIRTGQSSLPRAGSTHNNSHTNLLSHSQPTPKSMPLRGESRSPHHTPSPLIDSSGFETNVFAAELPAAPAPVSLPPLDTKRKSLPPIDRRSRGSHGLLGKFMQDRNSSGSDSDKLSTSPPKVDSGFATLVNSPVSEVASMPKSPLSANEMPRYGATSPALPPLPTFAGLPNITAEEAPLPPLPRKQVPETTTNKTPHNYHESYMSESSNYGEWNQPRESTYNNQAPARSQSLAPTNLMPEIHEDYASDYYDNSHSRTTLSADDSEFDNRRLSVMMRPLPPDMSADDPDETPEARANRIRSFYKEYFDKNEEEQPPMPQKPYQLEAGDYYDYEDYHQEHMNAATVMDEQRGFIVAGAPYAQPVTRRAMTPPPRAPPRFRSGPPSDGGRSTASRGSHAHGYGGQGAQYYSRSRTHSQTSRFDLPPRGQSAMSNQPRGRTQTRKPMPPPAPLTSLPTPSLLKDDAAFLATTIDFAPPASYRDLQSGRRPDSPMGTARPYSPSVRSFNPLASSFDDLNVIPSPHMLRKSGTFTSLDFAPPRRIRDNGADNMSDSASVRSGRSARSNISNVHAYNIRNGAYRVSKIPKELGGTRNELTQMLKPSWEQR